MSSDTHHERFEEIDWNEVSRPSWFSLSVNTKGFVAVSAVVIALFVYDLLFVPADTATFAAVTDALAATGLEIEWGYNVTQTDWLFSMTLLMLFFYGTLPLYQNPRMTRYYWGRFKENRPAMLSLAYLIVILVIGLVGPLFLSRPELSVLEKYQPPVFMTVPEDTVVQCVGEVSNGRCHGSWQYPFGTTSEGKDIVRIIVYGMQVSMKVGLISALFAGIIGSIVGIVAAYSSGLVDEVLMRYVDIQQTFPSFILFLMLTYLFGASLFLFILIFGGFSWGNTARYVRSNALQKTEEEYIQAAKASGASTWLIVRRHLVPNTASSIITNLTLLIPSFILFEAVLSFLGVGDPTIPSWGQAIASGRSDLAFAPWIATIPGIFLFFTILAFNFLGDALLDALNPRAETETEG
ncbi:MAG: ABC transporter permease [Haloarculaceae archaeon]